MLEKLTLIALSPKLLSFSEKYYAWLINPQGLSITNSHGSLASS